MSNGLVYSESTNGGYRKYCVLFARCSPKITDLGVIVSKSFTNFKKPAEKLNQQQFHKSAVETALMFHKVQCNKISAEILFLKSSFISLLLKQL